MEKEELSIGLCLSGGGFRAVAFHLGCLRALNKHDLLGKVKIISTVSGGSIIGAMYAYSDSSFGEFEDSIIKLLKSGMQLNILKDWLCKGKFILNIINLMLVIILWGLYKIITFIGKDSIKLKRLFQLQRPFSATQSLISVLKMYFGNKMLSSKTRNSVEIVINACELGTQTAFRFGNKYVSNWKFGKVNPKSILISEAVAASAAYPVILPALNKKMLFEKGDGEKVHEIVTLTDGGMYENLGVSPLFPDRSPEYGYPNPKVDIIVACDAGHGTAHNTGKFQWFVPRLIGCFDSLMRRIQSLNFDILHKYKENKKINGFIMPFLGQIDSKLPQKPDGFISREKVINYPTDFKAMKEEDIDLLSSRGEQITEILIREYL